MRTAFCFNLDGTMTTMDILPCIASELCVADEMATLTDATTRGLIDFEASLRLRTLILGQVPLKTVHSIVTSIPLHEKIVAFVRAHAKDCFLITGHVALWVTPIQEKCACTMHASSAHFSDQKVVLEAIVNKRDVISQIRGQGYDRIVAVGNTANDALMLAAADVAIAFGASSNLAPFVVGAAHYVIHEETVLCNLLTALSSPQQA